MYLTGGISVFVCGAILACGAQPAPLPGCESDLIEAHRPHRVGIVMGSGGEKPVLRLKETEQDGKKGIQISGETVKTMVGRMGQKSWTAAGLDQTSCNLAKSGGTL